MALITTALNDRFGGISYSNLAILNFADRPEIATKITIFPNPADEELNINLGKITATAFVLKIIDSRGVTVLTKTTQAAGGRIQENVSGLSSGIYIVAIADKHTGIPINTSKLIKR